MIEVTVVGLGIAPPSSAPLLLLKERNGERVLPIGIGTNEAQAIAMPLQGVKPPRPLTHDVFTTIIATMGGQLRRVEITALNDNTFYARLTLEHGGQEQAIDIRPSDAVALAVRSDVPIFVAEAVFDQAGVIPQEPEAAGGASPSEDKERESAVDESKLTPFKEFIDTLDIDDLGPATGS